MAYFSKKSKEKLATCEKPLQDLFNRVIEVVDCTVVSGHRSPEEQRKLYMQGRGEAGNIVTYKDGYQRLSEHNFYPSRAVDVVPYPIDWNNIERFKIFGEMVMVIAEEMGIKIAWGGNWEWKDYPHYQLIK